MESRAREQTEAFRRQQQLEYEDFSRQRHQEQDEESLTWQAPQPSAPPTPAANFGIAFRSAFHFQTVLVDKSNITAASIRSIEENKVKIEEDPPLKLNETDRESSSIRLSDRKLSTIRWTNFLSSWRKPAKEDVCPICLDEYHPGERICTSKTMACSHVFHQECMGEWLRDHNTCPICRTVVISR